MVNGDVRINLIFNAERRADRTNVLFDETRKYPGITHPAFVVDDLGAVIAVCNDKGIPITEGPVDIGERRRALFIRDPDGNVLEFDEFLAAG